MSTSAAPTQFPQKKTRLTPSLCARSWGVETAKIAGFALLALFSAERWAIGATPVWGELSLSAVSDYEEARSLISRKKWAEAAIILKSVTRKDPDYVPAAIQLAETLFYSNRRDEG